MMPSKTFPPSRTCWTILLTLLVASSWGQSKASLTVTIILNKPEVGGVLRVAFCPDKGAYDSEQGCTLLTLDAVGHVLTGTFDDVPVGNCAVKVFHDINSDGKLNTSWLGWPQEPYGFSNDAPVNMGPPPFKFAMIGLKEGSNTARIALR